MSLTIRSPHDYRTAVERLRELQAKPEAGTDIEIASLEQAIEHYESVSWMFNRPLRTNVFAPPGRGES
jgi:hypothetical protein